MPWLSQLLLSSLAAAIMSVLLVGMASAHATSSTSVLSTNGCNSGDVCMYTPAGDLSGSPEHTWFQYGCYNLTNEFGNRDIFNNQFGGATFTVYFGFNCTNPSTNPQTKILEGETWIGDITPINSISLDPPVGCPPPCPK